MKSTTDAWVLPAASLALGRQRRQAKYASGFFLAHFWFPLVAFAVLLAVATLGQGDRWLADRIYGLEGHAWTLRHAYLTEQLAHAAGRGISAAAWLLVLIAWLASLASSRWSRFRLPLAYLLLATLLSAALVAWIKMWSNMDCPWDLVRYGGDRPYVGLFDLRPQGLGRGRCFPAGHASSGYAWLALYFFFSYVRPRWRWAGLAMGAGLGLAFGISQQLRGAHFLSHDLWTIALCWTTALALRPAFLGRMPPQRHAVAFARRIPGRPG